MIQVVTGKKKGSYSDIVPPGTQPLLAGPVEQAQGLE